MIKYVAAGHSNIFLIIHMKWHSFLYVKMSKISKNLLNIFENYGSSATVHGISYIFKRNSRLKEKPVYILAVTGAVFFAIWSSRDIYISWKSDPVLTTIENFAYPIENIPFPSITICPQGADNSILKSVLFKQFNEYLDRKNSVSYTHLTLPTILRV